MTFVLLSATKDAHKIEEIVLLLLADKIRSCDPCEIARSTDESGSILHKKIIGCHAHVAAVSSMLHDHFLQDNARFHDVIDVVLVAQVGRALQNVPAGL